MAGLKATLRLTAGVFATLGLLGCHQVYTKELGKTTAFEADLHHSGKRAAKFFGLDHLEDDMKTFVPEIGEEIQRTVSPINVYSHDVID